MLFNSVEFWVFFPACLAAFWAAPPRWRNLVLLVASYVFYGFWDWRFLGLILLSTGVDHACALAIHRATRRVAKRRFLLISLVVNLGVLGFFKYANFFADSFAVAIAGLGLGEVPPLVLDVALPVGISFYTFQTLGYTVDVFRGTTRPVERPLDFALYVAYFPQLVAGPIERSSRLLPQIVGPKELTAVRVRRGSWLILIGLVKKVVLADNMATIADHVFSTPGEVDALSALLGIYAFALQIYGDFSGYTDIARGVSAFFGIDLVLNFRRPYFSTGASDFWRRWHISLSEWLRDYLYIPLGGNRRGNARTYFNLAATMLLGGLWHGASWMFVVWGGLHGLYLVVQRLVSRGGRSTQRAGRGRSRFRGLLAGVVWFHAVCLAWVFFRASSLKGAFDLLGALATPLHASRFSNASMATFAACAAPIFLLDLWEEVTERRKGVDLHGGEFLVGLPTAFRALLYAALLAYLALLGAPAGAEFIYFQF